MRGKRSKQYRKQLQQYGQLGFREPYQVLVDAEFVQDASRFAMDLVPALQRTLHTKQVKPYITQCSMRHLYSKSSEPGMRGVIDKVKDTCERRRCGHHPDEYPEPLGAFECLMHVVDEKGSRTNKHRYVVASQDMQLRRALREVKGVPLLYLSRSVMIMEPMSHATAAVLARDEKAKLHAGVVATGAKRKREAEDEGDREGQSESEGGDGEDGASASAAGPAATLERKKKTKNYGPKGPNPLSVKKAKKQSGNEPSRKPKPAQDQATSAETPAKRKRKRKHMATAAGDGTSEDKEINASAASPAAVVAEA